MTNSNNSPAATRALELLTGKLGAATDVTSVGPSMQLTFGWAGQDLAALFLEIGAKVDVSMQLPALPPRRGGVMVVGDLEGLRFNAKTEAGDQGQTVVVSVYPETSDAAAHKQRLEAIHSMADSLFAGRNGDATQDALISYVLSKLNDKGDPNAVRQLAARLASVLADHLAGQVTMDQELAAQLAAATGSRR